MKVSEIKKLQEEIGQIVKSKDGIMNIIEVIEFEQEFSAFQKRAGKTERAQHAKEHGLVTAIFTPESKLAIEYQKGVFKAGSSYDARVRFSNGNAVSAPDSVPGLQGMAIKLTNVDGENLMPGVTDQDFLLVSYPNFIVPNMTAFGEAIKAQAQGEKATAEYFKKNPKAYEIMQSQKGFYLNPLEIQFFSVTPYQLGDHLVKYSAIPTASPNMASYPKSAIPTNAPPNYLQLAMENTLDSRGVSFDFMIQLFVNEKETPTDDATVIWNSPFIKVATIDIPQQYFTAPGQLASGQIMSFNPWHCLPVHKPVGSLNIARKFIYENLYQFRIERNQILANSPKQHPMNLILKIKEAPVTVRAADGTIIAQTQNITENYKLLRAALSAGGTGLESVKTIHFARNIFLDPVTKKNADGVDEVIHYKTVSLITSYDEGFADYIIDFAEVIYERFNFLLSFIQGTEDIEDEQGNVRVQKNTKNFVKFIATYNVPPIAFYCAYPELSVVQILQNEDSRNATLTNQKVCPMGFD